MVVTLHNNAPTRASGGLYCDVKHLTRLRLTSQSLKEAVRTSTLVTFLRNHYTGNFLEKSLQRLKKRRPEVKTFLNYIAIKDRSLTAELVSKCGSIELVWSNLGPQKKNKNKKIGRPFSPTAEPGSSQAILT